MPWNTRLSTAALIAVLATALGTVRRAAAQGPAAASADTSDGGLPTLTIHAPSIFGAWIAAARHSPFRTRTGVDGYRDFYLASARVGWQLRGDDASHVRVAYFIDIIPAALSTGMPDYQWDARCQPTTYCPGATPISHNVYGFGMSPIGWSVAVGSGAASLTIEATGGGLWFARRVPDPVATRFNFTASAGPTLELRLTPSEALRIGYLWHHTSNGGTGHVNPGLNSGILAAGMIWRERH